MTARTLPSGPVSLGITSPPERLTTGIPGRASGMRLPYIEFDVMLIKY